MSTIVFVHAHPDDEALLTGGTMAMLARHGHRVVLVTATSGDAGLAATAITTGQSLADTRVTELHSSAAILGCARIHLLGYPDSGFEPRPHPGSFATLGVEPVAERLAAILREERADVVTGYDAAGGYGHRDHIQVHRVTRTAVQRAGTPTLLEATVDRRALQRALRLARPFTHNLPEFHPARFSDRYTAHHDITHRIDVRDFLEDKQAAMRAHASQRTADDSPRTLSWLLDLPAPLGRLALGHEWFVRVGQIPPRRPVRNFPVRPARGTSSH